MDRQEISMKNRVNSAQGRIFEQQILMACQGYMNENRAFIEKTPEPFRVLEKKKDGTFKGRFQKYAVAQPDFKGTLNGGKTIVFEAKHTLKSKMAISVLTNYQQEALELHYKLGAVAGVCVCMDNEFFFVPYKFWRLCNEQYDRKYFTKENLKQFAVKFNGAVNFLDFINGRKAEQWEVFCNG